MTQSVREQCVLHANCQGEPLALLLAASPEFSARWHITHYTNYTREVIPPGVLENATLFLYQHLGREWDEFASEALLERMKSGAFLCIPNMFFAGYWPFWTSKSPMDFGDFFLDKLFEAGAGKPEIVRIYLHGKAERVANLDTSVAETLRHEELKERHTTIKTAGFVAENWRKMRLFQTVNHPDIPLLFHVAQKILVGLGLPTLPESVRDSFSYGYEGFELPIHPKVAAYHQLPFASEDTQYSVFGRELTFAQYVSRYIDCRANGMESSFLAYLQLV